MKKTSRTIFSAVVGLALLAGPSLAQLVSVIDDLEGGTNQNKFLAYWYMYNDSKDGGNSVITNGPLDPITGEFQFTGSYPGGRDGSSYAAELSYEFGSTEPSCGGTCTFGQFVGLGTMLAEEGKTIDISTASKITFWAKATAPMAVRVEVATQDVADFAYFRIEAVVGAEWKQFAIDFTDPLTFAQPSWGEPVDFNKTLAEKIQWSVSAEYKTNPASGTLWIDDVEIHDYIWQPPTVCTSLGAAGAGTGAVLSDMDGEIPQQNVMGGYWYAYNDAENRIVGPGEYTDIFGGVRKDVLDPTLLTIDIDGNGFDGTNGAFIEFQLGPAYPEAGSTILPFAGIGTRTSNNLGTMFYNAKQDGATGVSFDYMTSETVKWVRFEAFAPMGYSNAGLVHHCLVPGTAGAWKSASVDFTTSLFLPAWDEVKLLPPAMKLYKSDRVEKFQWAVQDAPGLSGSFAIDNVKMVGAAVVDTNSIMGIASRTSAARAEMNVAQSQNILVVTLPSGSMENITVDILDLSGRIVSSQSREISLGTVRINTQGLSGGLYSMRVRGMDNGHDVELTKKFSFLK